MTITGGGSGGAVARTQSLATFEIVRALGTIVAPSGSTTSGFGIKIMARDPNSPSTLWACSTANALVRSTDDGVTWALQATIAGASTIDAMFVTNAGTVLAMGRAGAQGSSAYTLYRSTDNVTFPALGGQPFLQVSPYSYLLGQMSIAQDSGGNIYLAEYSFNVAPGNENDIHLFKSTNDGVSFSAIATWSKTNAAGSMFDAIRHIHSVQVDPNVSGRLWICCGDNVAGEARIGYSDDGGNTFTYITRSVDNASYARSRAVSLMFTSSAVFWAADTPDVMASIYRYDRSSGAIAAVAGPWPNSFYGSHTVTIPDGTQVMMVAAAVEPTSQINRDDLTRIVASADGGTTWSTVFVWKRTQVDQVTQAGCWRYTAIPDANGAVWLSYEGLSGTEPGLAQGYINLKIQPRKRYATDQPPRDWHVAFEAAAEDTVISTALPASITASDVWPIFIAPTDLIVVAIAVQSKSAMISDPTNYWTIAVENYRAGVNSSTISQCGGASQAQTAYVSWNVLNANGLLKIKQGDLVVAHAIMSGAPATLTNCSVQVRYRRANQNLIYQ